jgi:DNA-directed RNA polymerase specialized sigma24 family protein
MNMNLKNFSYKEALLLYQSQGQMSKELFRHLHQLVALVLRSKGIQAPSLIDEIFSQFLEKLLNFKSSFYIKMRLFQEKQVRSFLSMTIQSVLIDYYRREKTDRVVSLENFEPWQADCLQPEESWHTYKLEANLIYQSLWQKLPSELQEIFCQIYDGGFNLEFIAQKRQVSLGKIHKDKTRISEIIAKESSLEEVAQMVYRLMAIEFCSEGYCLSQTA